MVLGSTAASRLQAIAAVYVAGTGSTPVVGVYTSWRSIVAAFALHTLHYYAQYTMPGGLVYRSMIGMHLAAV